MNVTINDIERILKTLPIGYYIKRNVNVKLDQESDTAHYNPMTDTITVGTKTLLGLFDKLEDDANIEEDIRTLLYHEVSHAFITPVLIKEVTPELNIFEDERIESVLRHYYKGVNFREFCKRMNGFHGEEPKNADEAYYQLVRYRIGEKKWLERLHELIKSYSNLTRNSAPWSYENDVENFYRDFINEYKEKEKEEESGSKEEKEVPNEHSEEFTDAPGGEEKINAEETECETPMKEEDESSIADDEAENDKEDEALKEEYNDKLANDLMLNIKNFANAKLIESINQILSRVSSASKRNGSAINAYSGQFDVRSTIRDDYKFFVQQNRLGHVKAYSKVKLNLFIDRSGSFRSSERIVNQLLYALLQFEKKNPDFEFDLVTCGMTDRLEPRTNRTLTAIGGNRLSKDIFGLFNQLQTKQATVYNIVLFDGDAFTDVPYREEAEAKKNFGAFNTRNTTIISDKDNKDAIEAYCQNAKRIYTKDYAGELIEKVLQTLMQISR